jgi:hypothetical protein
MIFCCIGRSSSVSQTTSEQDIQIAAANPTTPATHNVVAAPVALAFESTFKRHSSDGRDATVDGVHSHQACPLGLQRQ